MNINWISFEILLKNEGCRWRQGTILWLLLNKTFWKSPLDVKPASLALFSFFSPPYPTHGAGIETRTTEVLSKPNSVEEHLPSMCKAQGFIPSTTKKKRQEKEKSITCFLMFFPFMFYQGVTVQRLFLSAFLEKLETNRLTVTTAASVKKF